MRFIDNVQRGFMNMDGLDSKVKQCRDMATDIGVKLHWRASGTTMTSVIRKNGSIIWEQTVSHDMPHHRLALLYDGLCNHLFNLYLEHEDGIRKMAKLEQERAAERQVINLPDWSQRQSGDFNKFVK
ncbi:MAG: hypothetical protein EOO20_05380 [Chryseobacterium sp.]|nr:MAG: hypothetical protein EOO20_05380 [Chryseobacterium sp.]